MKLKWTASYPQAAISYPIVAERIVVVIEANNLVALDASNGHALWTRAVPSSAYWWAGIAYDNGIIFALIAFADNPHAPAVYALDLKTGKKVWTQKLSEYSFNSPPATGNGQRATGNGQRATGNGQRDGLHHWKRRWWCCLRASRKRRLAGLAARNGRRRRLISGRYADRRLRIVSCPQTYDFDAISGEPSWHNGNPSCYATGGSTPVLNSGLLFVAAISSSTGGLILNADDGKTVGSFDSGFAPAFANKKEYLLDQSGADALEAIDPKTQQVLWQAQSPGEVATPPIVVNSIAYIETTAGELLGYRTGDGKLVVDRALHAVAGNSPYFGTGLGSGDDLLIVPASGKLFAFESERAETERSTSL